MPQLKFPENFLWGVAYSSHQVEGNNVNNDWWQWEQRGKVKDKSGWACDSWNRYLIDHKLAQDLGCNAFRLSLEWSRIEPAEGVFSNEAIEHYRHVLQDLKHRGMKRTVTLWHWTSPTWFSEKYGWHREGSVEAFTKYCEKVIDSLGEEIDILITINEPRLPLNKGYLISQFPPGKRNPFAFAKARRNMIEAHKRCYEICKNKKKTFMVGVNQFCNDFDFWGKSKKISFLTERVEDFYNWHFFEKTKDWQDFFGIDYYFGIKISFRYPFFEMLKEKEKISDLSWGIYPEGIHEVVMDAWNRYKKPIYIFENGIADEEDKYRSDFIKDHLKWLHMAIEEGADVRGYFHWSLVDNFEWADGYGARFGLCEMDYGTMERKPRPSYYEYQKIIKSNELNI